MALTMQAVGCCSSFTSVGAPLTTRRGPPSPCRRARCPSPRSSLVFQGGDECSLTNVDYDESTSQSQWLSADFLDLRLRSSGLICNEAVQALRNHFQKKNEQQTAAEPTVISSTDAQRVVEQATSSASASIHRLPMVTFYDEALFAQLYNNPNNEYSSMCSFLDESFC